MVAGRFMVEPSFLTAPAELGSGMGNSKKPSVLIVEDDVLVASDLEHELTKVGFKVVGIAVSAFEAITMAKNLRPSVAIMDVRLVGERDGVDAALELFRDHNIRCVFATAHSDEKTRARALPASPLGWLAKPYSPQAVIDALKKALSS